MKHAVCLSLLMSENDRHHGAPLYDAILNIAHRLDLPGGSAFRGLAGYGRSGRLHEAHFLELAGDLPVELRLYCEEAQAQTLLKALAAESIDLPYAMTAVEMGRTLPDPHPAH